MFAKSHIICHDCAFNIVIHFSFTIPLLLSFLNMITVAGTKIALSGKHVLVHVRHCSKGSIYNVHVRHFCLQVELFVLEYKINVKLYLFSLKQYSNYEDVLYISVEICCRCQVIDKHDFPGRIIHFFLSIKISYLCNAIEFSIVIYGIKVTFISKQK